MASAVTIMGFRKMYEQARSAPILRAMNKFLAEWTAWKNNPPVPQTMTDDGSAVLGHHTTRDQTPNEVSAFMAYEEAEPIFNCYDLSKWGEGLTEEMRWRFNTGDNRDIARGIKKLKPPTETSIGFLTGAEASSIVGIPEMKVETKREDGSEKLRAVEFTHPDTAKFQSKQAARGTWSELNPSMAGSWWW